MINPLQRLVYDLKSETIIGVDADRSCFSAHIAVP